ncbi:uncharacterized protein LACBIDRAFT_292707 [Laccaria bicolor S238N-H82]|uniref:Predicted protein n=1 Tax=Laccaria bicolor (strain S238N-H82 / ATCC MYA-4686) TaxID=486041 RepID=B0CZU7_LACBS|nr:uncharacterized protein LACBIDRAFT_292707 [Laccaria bicolor S238N-H82]EDR12680.1 predicted protein [Laccaria bicolor S238N-H82]|eukprot:XP_001876944.1 predicted protein [Laccaria bicolor S238N-H82]
MYGDGWWQGRNLEGKVGLFPKSYTAPAAPSTEVPAPQSAPSAAAESSSAPTGEPEITTTIASPQPKQPTATFLSGPHDDEGDMEGPDSGDLQGNGGDEVMKATMTDVQRAIEQLGRGGADGEGSFTFASSHGGDTETDDTDFEMSDTERANDVNGAQDWHKGARTKLAERARRAVENAEKLEAMTTGIGSSSGTGRVVSAPPIQAELSDESDDEEDPSDRMDFTSRSSKFQRDNPYILEEDEELENGEASKGGHVQDVSMDTATTITHLSSDHGDSLQEEAQTATKASFPVFESPPPSNLPPPETNLLDEKIPSPARLSLPSPISPNSAVNEHFAITPIPLSAPDKWKPSSIPTTLEVGKKDPSEWTVEEVVEWLKSKGFDQAICDKFIEQEITGDVLLELDVNLLKTEIGVMAFGKRMRIANAITDLRRPPSIVYSDHPPTTEMPSPSSPMYNTTNTTSTPPRVHSRTQSQSHSHHSFLGHNYSQSVQSSLGSPIGYVAGTGMPTQFSFGGPGRFEPVAEGGSSSGDIYSQNGNANAQGLEIPPVVGEGGPPGLGMLTFEEALGKGTADCDVWFLNLKKARPSQLTLSPSDGALKEKIILQPEQHEYEDRGHLSEGEVVPSQSMRRRLFGRSHDSTTSGGHSSSKHSNGTSSPGAHTHSHEDKDTTSLTNGSIKHARVRKSIDGGKPSDNRLSLFAVPFGGKSRKPPPSAGEHEYHAERSSMFGLPKGMRKSSSTHSQRPSTPTGSPKEKLKEPQSPFKDHYHHEKGQKEEVAAEVERSTLRKRVISSVQQSNGGSSSVDGKSLLGVGGGVTQGQSILGQIGEPDHVGWMRKKSDRYNSWKPRYFVLKGRYLYWLKNSSASETRLKGYLDIMGYKVTVDETLDPGRYGFRIDHDTDKPHFFSSDEKSVIQPVISSCNIPTIPLVVAQAMNPAPRPPSPTARDATQRALRRENPNQLSSRDARVLMGLSSDMGSGQTHLDSFFAEHSVLENEQAIPTSPKSAPPRPSREMRRANSVRSALSPADNALVEWANSHLSASLQLEDPTVSFFGGLALLRLAESIKGRPSSPPVPDSAFPVGPTDDKLDGLFRLFDFLLDNDVKMGSVSINDIRQGKRDKILQLLKALKSWDDKRRALAQTMNGTLNPSGGGAFLMPTGMQWANMHTQRY